MTFLNVGADYPDSPLTVVIYSDKLQNFSFKPSDYYKGKTICIIGRIKIYKGKPEIISNSEHDIFIK
jgi:DNA/RNA endonuclease YhcR with UshA esterase domain